MVLGECKALWGERSTHGTSGKALWGELSTYGTRGMQGIVGRAFNVWYKFF